MSRPADDESVRRWIVGRGTQWRTLVGQIGALRTRRTTRVEDALGAVEAYRGLARDVATARRVAPESRTTAALESLYGQLHATISRRPRGGLAALRLMLLTEAPRAAASIRGRILLMAAVMTAGACCGWWLISTYPDLIRLIASQQMIDQVEKGRLWTDDILNVVPSSVMSVGILANNISVSVLAFAAGALLGLATFYLVAFNGLMLGATFAFVHQHSLAAALFRFIVAHGPVELSVICIAGACGVALGESIIRPSLQTRRDAFQQRVHELAPLLVLCAGLLVFCGLIEGFISPDPGFPLASRVAIGLCYWVFMLILLSGKLARRRAGSCAAQARETLVSAKDR